MSHISSVLRSLCAASLVLPLAFASPALAKGKKKGGGGGGGEAHAPSGRALTELMGKFKWGMTPDDIAKSVADEIHPKYVELINKEKDVYKQDQLRKQEQEEVDKVKASLIVFDGKKTGWDSSIIDKEFVHRNDESMMIRWEKDQRRFLFFWHGKLYKQYIAFNAEHPAFAGKTFDDFANIIQNRYGQAETKFGSLRTKDDVTVDHLEWPPAQDISLWALDQSSFYGNFCLKLTQASVMSPLDKSRADKVHKGPKGNALIDAVTAPGSNDKDPNDDVVDRIVGQKRATPGNPAPGEK